jgi:hypothetical protein
MEACGVTPGAPHLHICGGVEGSADLGGGVLLGLLTRVGPQVIEVGHSWDLWATLPPNAVDGFGSLGGFQNVLEVSRTFRTFLDASATFLYIQGPLQTVPRPLGTLPG